MDGFPSDCCSSCCFVAHHSQAHGMQQLHVHDGHEDVVVDKLLAEREECCT